MCILVKESQFRDTPNASLEELCADSKEDRLIQAAIRT
jgi:hypothetical protein